MTIRSAAGSWLLWAAVFCALAYALWLPFHQHYDAPVAGLRVSQWRTVLWHYLGVHALLLFVAGSWLAWEAKRRLWPSRRLSPRLSPGLGAAPVRERDSDVWSGGPNRRKRRFLVPLAAVPLLLVWFAVPMLREWTTAAILGGFLFAAWVLASFWMLRRQQPEAPAQLLLLTMAMAAFGIGIGVDVVTLQNDIDRMNTVFKFYLNAWVLLGTVGGVALWQLWASGFLRRRPVLRGVWLGALAVLVLASAVFPVLGTRARLADRFDTDLPLTLDGTAYQATAVYDDPEGGTYPLRHDAEALEFLRQNVQGSPVVLEGVTPQYRWTPRMAKYTGLPVVVGYEWHQIQQRGLNGGGSVLERVEDVETAYNTTDEAVLMALLEQYEVEYIYVGPTERLYFAAAGIAKFDRLLGRGLELAYSNDTVRVYRVTGIVDFIRRDERGSETYVANLYPKVRWPPSGFRGSLGRLRRRACPSRA
ncbi:MAG: DUF2298 domain-containing protein [Dehalococcoidia bacterium]